MGTSPLLPQRVGDKGLPLKSTGVGRGPVWMVATPSPSEPDKVVFRRRVWIGGEMAAMG